MFAAKMVTHLYNASNPSPPPLTQQLRNGPLPGRQEREKGVNLIGLVAAARNSREEDGIPRRQCHEGARMVVT